MTRISKAITVVLFLAFVLEFVLSVQLVNFQGLSAKNLAIYLMFILAMVRIGQGQTSMFGDRKVFIYVIAFAGWCFASLLLAYYTQHTSIYDEFVFYKAYMDPFALMLITYYALEDEQSVRFVVSALLLFLIISNLITVFGSLGLINVKRVTVDAHYGRTRGAFAEPNQYAAYIALFLPAFVNALARGRGLLQKGYALAGLFLGVLCLMFTGSRGGMVSLVVGLSTLLILNRSRRGFLQLLKPVGVLAAVGLIGVAALKLLPEASVKGLTRNVVERAQTQNLEEYSSGRLYAWRVGVKLFLSNPITGIGWNTFSKKVGFNSHNDYILFLTTTGIPGLFLFINLHYSIWKSVKRRLASDPEHADMYVCYLSGSAAFMTAMMFVNMFNVLYFYFFYSAAILKLGALSASAAEAPKRAPNWRRRWARTRRAAGESNCEPGME